MTPKKLQRIAYLGRGILGVGDFEIESAPIVRPTKPVGLASSKDRIRSERMSKKVRIDIKFVADNTPYRTQ